MSIKSELAAIAGKEFTFDDPEILKQYSKDHSLRKPAMPNYMVQPASTDQVKSIVELANKERIPLIPCSSRTHLYGATIPSQGGVIVDLVRMNRIYPLDKVNNAVRIEAGVTWGQLQPELSKDEYMTLMPLFPQAQRSVVSSLLEREVLLDCMYEYGEPMLTIEAVFPDGRIYRSGSASVKSMFQGSPSAGVYPQGPGLDLFRLFQGAQGTMGIVTWAIVKIEYRPKVNKVYFASFKKLDEAIEPIYRLQRRNIGRESFLLNRVNLAAILTEKWPTDYKALIRALPPWTMVLVLSGGRRRPEEKVAYEEEALKEVANEFRLDITTSLPGAGGAERRLVEMLRGPWPEGKTYWKQGLKGSFQDLFFITTLDKAAGFASSMADLVPRHSYSLDELGCYLQPIERGRACHLEFNLYHSPEDAEERGIVRTLYGEAAQVMFREGALFTRPYGDVASMVYERATAYTTVLKKIKKWLDPNNIMSPGNICF